MRNVENGLWFAIILKMPSGNDQIENIWFRCKTICRQLQNENISLCNFNVTPVWHWWIKMRRVYLISCCYHSLTIAWNVYETNKFCFAARILIAYFYGTKVKMHLINKPKTAEGVIFKLIIVHKCTSIVYKRWF